MRRRSTLPLWIEIPAVFLARVLYRAKVLGVSHVPAAGGAVVIANHLSYVDAFVLQLVCPRPLRFVAYKGPDNPKLLCVDFEDRGGDRGLSRKRPAVAQETR